MTQVVTIGGGTGTFTVLSGLKKYPFDLTSIVTVADSGGSTGKLRDEFGDLPVGDFRMALTALASSDEEAEILRKLFLYRFNKGGKGLEGHNFGNLFLVAMSDILGSRDKAIKYAAKILGVKGRVLPITSESIDLVAEYEGGKVLRGEDQIDAPSKNHDGTKKITNLWVEPEATILPETAQVLLDADFIVLGPGDLYTSIFPNLIVNGAQAALKKSKAKIIYIVNLVTKYGQTYNFTAKDHVEEIKKYIGRYPDFILVNATKLPEKIIEKYEEEKDFPVINDLEDFKQSKVILADLLVPRMIEKKAGDVVKRSLLRHDSDKLAWEIVKIIKESDFTALTH